jgi:hypothetical protein
VKYATNANLLLVTPELGIETILAVNAKEDGSIELTIDVKNLPTSRFVRLIRDDGGYWVAQERGIIPAKASDERVDA